MTDLTANKIAAAAQYFHDNFLGLRRLTVGVKDGQSVDEAVVEILDELEARKVPVTTLSCGEKTARGEGIDFVTIEDMIAEQDSARSVLIINVEGDWSYDEELAMENLFKAFYVRDGAFVERDQVIVFVANNRDFDKIAFGYRVLMLNQSVNFGYAADADDSTINFPQKAA